jgi:hypothetical protein
MAVSRSVIDAYKRRFTRAQLETTLDKALEDRASGVQVTQVNFQDGGGSGQMIGGDPNEVIEIIEAVLKILDAGEGATSAPPGLASSVNFSTRRTET